MMMEVWIELQIIHILHPQSHGLSLKAAYAMMPKNIR